MSIKIKDLPEMERPYEKMEMYGEKVLSNAELLAIIIKTGTKEETAVQLSQKLLSLNETTKEDLNYLHTQSLEELMQVKGIGKVKAIQLKAIGEIAIRMFRNSKYKKMVVKTPADIFEILMSELRFETSEIIKVVILNIHNEILKIQTIASGSNNFVNVQIKKILAEPIKMDAPKFILVHNHPGGSVKPSLEDIETTKNLYDISLKLGIEMVDHIIIAGTSYTSIFLEWLNQIDEENKKTEI